MAQITIKKTREYDYDEKYEVDIRTSKVLTEKDYADIVGAIKTIEAVLDTHLDFLIKKRREANEANKPKKSTT